MNNDTLDITKPLINRLREVTLELIKCKDQISKTQSKLQISEERLSECQKMKELLQYSIDTIPSKCLYVYQCPLKEALKR